MDPTVAKDTTFPGRRTFDCPWCGAITTIPENYLGDHLTCPECSRATKLTDKNTSTRPPYEAPPDAPPIVGDRSFDCPWCGAISSVPSSHLGEHFTCPECKKGTKLTELTTRVAPITESPPDAPPPEWEVAARRRRIVVILAVVVAVGAGVAVSMSGGGKKPTTTGAGGHVAEQPGTPPRGPGAGTEPTPPESPEGVTPPTPTAPSAVAEAQARLDEALNSLTFATVGLSLAKARLEIWEKQNAARIEAKKDVEPLRAIDAEQERLLAEADPSGATPAKARAYNSAVAAFVRLDPARIRIAERVLEGLRKDPVGRPASGIATWEQINFFLPSIREAIGAMLTAASAAAIEPPADLVKAVEDAQASLEKAQQTKAAAELRYDQVKRLPR